MPITLKNPKFLPRVQKILKEGTSYLYVPLTCLADNGLKSGQHVCVVKKMPVSKIVKVENSDGTVANVLVEDLVLL